MFGLEIDPQQLITGIGAVVTGVLGANAGLFFKVLSFMKTEREEMRRTAEEFTRAMASRDKETRDLIYRVVEQRDRDIQHTQEVLVANATTLGRVERVLDRHETLMNSRNGH